MRLLLTGGGTAGHINPAVSIAEMIKQKEADSEILFVGTEEGMEKELIPRYGYNIKFINIHGFKRSFSPYNIKIMAELAVSIRKSMKIIRDFKPDAVVGTGGYVTGPVLYAASKMKIPSMVHESNAYPGVTVRLLSNKVDIVALAMKEAEKYLKNPKIKIMQGDYREALKGLRKGAFVYLDPPYMPISSSSSFTGYTEKGFSYKQQVALKNECDKLKEKGISFLQSNSDCPEIRELYKEYDIMTVQAKRSINSNANKRGEISEVLICYATEKK